MNEDKYRRQYKDFNEFCQYIETPDELGEWYIKNHVKWPNEHGSDHPFRWPDDIIRNKIGNCYDHGLFMYFFCKRKKINCRIVYCGIWNVYEEEGEQHNDHMGHIVTVFEKEGKWYEFDPQEYRQASHKVIEGPFNSLNEYSEIVEEGLKICGYKMSSGYKIGAWCKIIPPSRYHVFDKAYNKNIKNRDMFSLKYIPELGNQMIKIKKKKPIKDDLDYLNFIRWRALVVSFILKTGIKALRNKFSALFTENLILNGYNIKYVEDINIKAVVEESDYLNSLEEFYTVANRDYLQNLYIDGITEMFVLTDLYLNKKVHRLYEDSVVSIGAKKNVTQRLTTGVGSSFSNFLRKMITFLQNVIEDFTDKVDQLVSDDVEWLNKVNATFNDIPEEIKASLTITCVPWHKRQTVNRLKETSIDMAVDLKTTLTKVGQANDVKIDEIYQNMFPKYYKLDKKDFKNGALLYYRDGENSTEVYKAAQAIEALDAMRKYISNYKQIAKSSQQAVKKTIEDLKNTINEIEKQREANESFIVADNYSILEEASLYNTEFVDILYEGVTQKEEENPKEEDKKSDKKEEQKTVKDANKEKPKEEEKKKTNNTEEEDKNAVYDRKITACKHIVKIMSTAATAKMNVCEEIEKSYISILHQVYDGIKKYNRDDTEDKKNTHYNEELRRNKDIKSEDRRKDNQNKFKERAEHVGGAKLIAKGVGKIITAPLRWLT